jgi:hypothetical protein
MQQKGLCAGIGEINLQRRRKEGERKRGAYGTCGVASNKYQPLDLI